MIKKINEQNSHEICKYLSQWTKQSFHAIAWSLFASNIWREKRVKLTRKKGRGQGLILSLSHRTGIPNANVNCKQINKQRGRMAGTLFDQRADSIWNIEARDRKNVHHARVSFRFRDKSNYYPAQRASRSGEVVYAERETASPPPPPSPPLRHPLPKLKTRYASNGWTLGKPEFTTWLPRKPKNNGFYFASLLSLERVMNHAAYRKRCRFPIYTFPAVCPALYTTVGKLSKVFFIQTSFPEFLVSR